jgi:hypothetical protein
MPRVTLIRKDGTMLKRKVADDDTEVKLLIAEPTKRGSVRVAEVWFSRWSDEIFLEDDSHVG